MINNQLRSLYAVIFPSHLNIKSARRSNDTQIPHPRNCIDFALTQISRSNQIGFQNNFMHIADRSRAVCIHLNIINVNGILMHSQNFSFSTFYIVRSFNKKKIFLFLFVHGTNRPFIDSLCSYCKCGCKKKSAAFTFTIFILLSV